MKEKMALMSVSNTGQAQRGQGGTPGPKAASSDGGDRESSCLVGWWPEDLFQAAEEVEGGGKCQYTGASETACDGGVAAATCFRRAWSRPAYRGCSVLVGCKCSCRDHDGELAAVQDGAAMQSRALSYSSDLRTTGNSCSDESLLLCGSVAT